MKMRLQLEQPHTNGFIYYRIRVAAFDPKQKVPLRRHCVLQKPRY